ncbi:MAG: STT3 domain-containing protein [Desulfovermiculus sp.]
MQRDSSKGPLCLFIFVVTYALTLGLRMYEAPAWDNSAFFIQGEKILATHDAYAWLAGAEGVGRKAGAALSDITFWVHSLTGIQYGNLAFWLPALISPLVVIPLILLGRHWRLEEGALAAGGLAAGCLGFFLRTRLGFYDTDLLALFFPLMFAVLLIIGLSPYLRSHWTTREEDFCAFNPAHRKRFLFHCLGTGLVGLVYMWFYSKASPILLTCLGTAGLCILILAPTWRQAGWLGLGLLITAALSLGSVPSWLGIAAVFWLLWRRPKWLESDTGLKWCLLGLALIIVLDANLLFLFWSQTIKVLKYAKVFSVEPGGEGGLNLPVVGQSIREVQNLDVSNIIHRVAGNWVVFGVAVLGLGYVLYVYPLSLVFVPLLGLSLFSFVLGNRFTMYGGTVLGIGLGFGASLLLLRLHMRKSLRVGVQLVLCVLILLPSWEIATGLSPAPILPKPYARTFLELKEKTPKDARLWQWWDYGYAAQYYAERITFGDGGVHGGNILYPLARVHMAHSPRQARQLMQHITVSQQEEFTANSTKYKNMDTFWKPYLADPVAGLEDMGAAQAEEFVHSLAEEKLDWPGDLPPQYFVVSWENLQLAYWISYYGTWDLVRGGADQGRIQQVKGEVNFDLDNGSMQLSQKKLELSGLDVVDKENPRHFSWSNTGGTYAILNPHSQELYLLDEKIYQSMMVQMLIRDPKRFEPDFDVEVDNFPWARAYRVEQ